MEKRNPTNSMFLFLKRFMVKQMRELGKISFIKDVVHTYVRGLVYELTNLAPTFLSGNTEKVCNNTNEGNNSNKTVGDTNPQEAATLSSRVCPK